MHIPTLKADSNAKMFNPSVEDALTFTFLLFPKAEAGG